MTFVRLCEHLKDVWSVAKVRKDRQCVVCDCGVLDGVRDALVRRAPGRGLRHLRANGMHHLVSSIRKNGPGIGETPCYGVEKCRRRPGAFYIEAIGCPLLNKLPLGAQPDNT
jgi:hypothetical protein